MENQPSVLGDGNRYLHEMYSTVDDIAAALKRSGVTAERPLAGCSDAEILSLESKYDVSLPNTYRRFLGLMGHYACGLGDQPEQLLYPRVLVHTENERDLIDRCNKQLRDDYEHAMFMLPIRRFASRFGVGSEPDSPMLKTTLFPRDALVIYMECGLPEYWAIRCNDADDSPVYRFDYEDDVIELRQQTKSLVDFLSSLLEWRLTSIESR